MNWRRVILIGTVLVIATVGVLLTEPRRTHQPSSSAVVLDKVMRADMRKAKKANLTLSDEPPAYSREAEEAGFQLDSPLRKELAVPGVLQLQGAVGNGLENDIIYVEIYYPGQSRATAIPVVDGHFATNLFLPDGSGDYHVILSIPTAQGSDQYVSATELKVKNVSTRPLYGHYYAPAFYRMGMSLSIPTDGRIEADTTFTMAGGLPLDVANRFIWIYVYTDRQEWNTFLSIQDGAFAGPIHLGGGKGVHWAVVLIETAPGSDRFDEVARIPFHNTNPKVTRQPLMVNPSGLKAKLVVAPFPSEVDDATLPVSGQVDPSYNGKVVSVTVTQGTKSDEKQVLRIENGRFTGDVILPFGAGEYSVELQLPHSPKWYKKVATLQVSNLSTTLARPVHYSDMAREKQITVTSPAPGVIVAADRLTVQGRFETNPGPFPFIIVETKLGDAEARYLLPIQNGTFKGDVWLRFGPGEYLVTLSITNDGTRYEGMAQFKVDNTGTVDQRETAPSSVWRWWRRSK